MTSRLRAPQRKRIDGPPRLVRLGTVQAPHGLRGDLKIRCDNPDASALETLHRLFLARDNQTREYRVVHAARLGRGHFKVRLCELNDCDAAAAMRGAPVLAAVSDLPPTAPNEFYYFEALGCEVRAVNGHAIGRIKESFFTGAHDVWVVQGEGREFLLPVVDEIIKSMDMEHRVVTIEPIPGLLD